MSLDNDISEKRQEIRTDNYGMSIGEWLSMYREGDLDIHPAFQRVFRWKDEQKTRLIESILLGIPIPPIFVSQKPDGTWDVIDGVQRLSTIFHLTGDLRDEDGNLVDQFTLTKPDLLPSLDGMKWKDNEDETKSLSKESQLLIRRAKLEVNIVQRESDPRAKFELFQRLNTGGSALTAQEVRNCILVMIDKDFFEWLQDLSRYSAFRECIALSERSIQESYDMELALRFLLLYKERIENLTGMGDVHQYLTKKMQAIFEATPPFDKASFEEIFKGTFDLILSGLGPDAFRKYNPENDRFSGGFLISAFETVALGIGNNFAIAPEEGDLPRLIRTAVQDARYTGNTGSGISAKQRIPNIIPLGRETFRQ